MIGSLDPETLRANQEKMNKRGKIIGVSMMAIPVLLTFFLGYLAYRDTIQRLNWVQTSGTVTVSTYSKSAAENEGRYYYEYEYVVDGTAYSGKDSDVGAMANRPPAQGAIITVYYDPANPQDSVTNTNKSDLISDFVVWGFCCGPAFFVFGAVILFVSTRKIKSV